MSAGAAHVRGLRRQALELLHLPFAEANPHGELGWALVVVVGSVSGAHGFSKSVGLLFRLRSGVLEAASPVRQLGCP